VTTGPEAIDHSGAEENAYFELHDLCFGNGTIASISLVSVLQQERKYVHQPGLHVFFKRVLFALPFLRI
jgi:hypothetical protein